MPDATPAIHTLPNGVRVVCDPMPGLETLALSVVVGRGSRWETPAQSGWAHLLEHMVFKGAGDRSAKDIVEVVEAQGGQINAATGHDRTSYQVRALRDGLTLGAEVIADLVWRPTLRADDLEREKTVINQEIAEAADTPDDLVFELAQNQAFAGQPLGRPILGAPKTVGAATADDLKAFHAGLYGPDAIVIGAAGAVDEGEVLRLAERLFSEGAKAPPLPAESPASFVGGQSTKAKSLEQAHLVLLLPAFGVRDPDYFALRLFAEILGGGMSSRLFQEVREHRGLAYAIDAYADTHSDAGVLGVYAGTSAEDATQAAQVAAGQVKAMVQGVEPPELARAKAQMKSATFMARESALARAEQAAGQVLVFDRLFSPAETAQSIDEVTADDIVRVGQRILADKVCACAVLGPKRSAGAGRAYEDALFG